MMHLPLRTDVAEPLERLRCLHEEALAAKAYAEALGPRIGMDIAEAVPGGIVSMVMRLAIGAGIAESRLLQNTIVTNVPGPPVQLYLAGAELVDSFGIGPLAPTLGLFHTVTSLVMNKKGSIIVAFVSCRDVMPDPGFYADCLRESFTELLHAVSPSRSAKRSRTAKAGPPAKPRARTRARKATKKVSES